MILSLATDRLDGPVRSTLARVGTADLTRDDVVELQDAMVACGVVDHVEQLISRHVAAALAALDERALDPEGVRELTTMAHQIAWRDA